MAKPLTKWTSNAALDTTSIYDQTGVTYDTIYPVYDAVVGNKLGQIPAAWAIANPKLGARWLVNPESEANLYAYDSAAHTYDSVVDTYDGIVTNENFADKKQPAAWSNY